MANLKDELFSVTESNECRKDDLFVENTAVKPYAEKAPDINILAGITSYEYHTILDTLEKLRRGSLRALAVPDEFISKYYKEE